MPDSPPAYISVDVVALTVRAERLEVLLVRRSEPPYQGCWALPGRFVRADEDLAAAAARGLAEKAGEPGLAAHLEQLATYGAPDRDPRGRVVTVAYLAFAPAPPSVAGDLDARWFPLAALDGAYRLAFDHAAILADGVERARAKLEYSSLGTAFCTEPFTAGELRRVYEAVWGVPLDPRNFWRKLSSTPGLLVEVPGRSVPGPTGGRPAARFRRGPATVLHPPILRPSAPCPVPRPVGSSGISTSQPAIPDGHAR
jgi:ADP-ribose pyrophosphatase YjhB (NUDIX family)